MGAAINVFIVFLIGFAAVLGLWGGFLFTYNNNHNNNINRLTADVTETNQLIETIHTSLSEEIDTVNATLCDKIMNVNQTLGSEISNLLTAFNGVNMSTYFDLNEAINVVNATLTDKLMDGDAVLQTEINNVNSTLTDQISERLLSVDGVLGAIVTQNIDLMVNGTGFDIQPDPMTHTIKLKNTGVVTVNSVSSLAGSSDLIVSGIGMITVNSYPMTSTIEIDGTALSTAYSNLQMEVNMHQMDIVNLQTNITTIHTEINNIQMMGNMLAQDLNGTTISLNMTIMELIMDVMTLQTTVVSLQNQINALNANNTVVPPGTINPFGGTVIPSGYLLCDGSQYSTVTYSALFNVVGTMYCPGACAMGMFAVPDLRGKIPAGQGGTALSGTMGSTVGTETHTLTAAQMPFHNHGGTTDVDGLHTHTVSFVGTNFNGPYARPFMGQNSFDTLFTDAVANAAGSHAHNFVTGGAGSGQAHPNIQPSLIVKYIIKT